MYRRDLEAWEAHVGGKNLEGSWHFEFFTVVLYKAPGACQISSYPGHGRHYGNLQKLNLRFTHSNVSTVMFFHLQTTCDCSVSFTAKFSNDPKLSIDMENSMGLGFWEMTLNLVLTWIIFLK